MKNEQEKNNSRLYLITAICVVGICTAVALRGCGVSDDGGGVDAVREELNAAESNQSAITAGIGNAERTVGDAEKTVSNAESAAIHIESGQRKAEAIIADCERILKQIRQRGKGETKPP